MVGLRRQTDHSLKKTYSITITHYSSNCNSNCNRKNYYNYPITDIWPPLIFLIYQQSIPQLSWIPNFKQRQFNLNFKHYGITN